MNGYKDLILWQKAMDLVDEIYRLVRFLPIEEKYYFDFVIRHVLHKIIITEQALQLQ